MVSAADDCHRQQGTWQQCGSAASVVAPRACAQAHQQQVPGPSSVRDGWGLAPQQQLQQAVLCAAVRTAGSRLAAAQQAVLSEFL